MEIDYVIPGCNDVSYYAAAKINQANIDCYQTTDILNNKENHFNDDFLHILNPSYAA